MVRPRDRLPEPLRLLARMGPRARHLAARLDLLRSIGAANACRRRRDERAVRRLGDAPWAIYRELWSEAAADLGADVRELAGGILEIRRDGARTRVWRHWVSLDDAITLRLALDKPLVHSMLAAAGLPVPDHVEVPYNELSQARRFLREAEGPCVVKPAAGTSGGLAVTAGVSAPGELDRACLLASVYAPRLLVERQVEGEMYRLLLLEGTLLDVVRRLPPHVTGDGRSSIAELIFAENRRRITDGARRELLRIDLECVLTLRRAGLSLETVLRPGVRTAVKVATSQNGARDNMTVHEQVAPELLAEAVAAARVVGLQLAGIDVVTRDLGRPLDAIGGAVIEVNGMPGLDYHYDVAEPAKATRVAVPILERLLLS